MSFELTPFLKNLTSGKLATLTKQAEQAPLASVPDIVSSGESTKDILRNQFRIIQENAVNPVKLSGNVQLLNKNVTSIGESINIIGETFGETTAVQQNQISSIQNTISELNKRVSGQLTDLGQSVTDASKAADDAGKSNFLNDIGGIFGIGAAGAAIALGLFALIALRR